MSKDWRRGVLAPGILLFWLLLPGSFGQLLAQSPSDSMRLTVGEELDSLIPLMRTLGDRAGKAEWRKRKQALDERQLPVDTFSVGPFRLIAFPDQREMAEEVFNAAWGELRPLVDGSEDLLEPWTFLFHYYWSREGMVLEGDTLLLRVDMSKRFPRKHLQQKATETIGNVLMRGMPSELYAWSGGQPRVQPQRMPWVARELVGTASVAIRRCYRGELEWCVEAMGLGETEGGWERWYTPEERRLYIQGQRRPYDGRDATLWEGCAVAGMEDACRVILQGRDPIVPFRTEARASLLGHALWTGGPGAFHRLRVAEGRPLLEQLSAAAGVVPDSLLASWRRSVLAARTSAWAGLVRSPIALFFWVILFGAFAARSTRWRLG